LQKDFFHNVNIYTKEIRIFHSPNGNIQIARKATLWHIFRLAGKHVHYMHAAENLTGLCTQLSGHCTPSSANAARAQHAQHN
jgi:hypothetical protein